MKPTILAMSAIAAALLVTGCTTDGYGYGRGPSVGVNLAYDGYYDNYYGNIYDGYWAPSGVFYYRSAPGVRYIPDRGRHFRRELRGNEGDRFRPIHGERRDDRHDNRRDNRRDPRN